MHLGRFLQSARPWPAGRSDQDWDALTRGEQELLQKFAGTLLDETLRLLLDVAESPGVGLQDVADNASYWLIELLAQRSGDMPD